MKAGVLEVLLDESGVAGSIVGDEYHFFGQGFAFQRIRSFEQHV